MVINIIRILNLNKKYTVLVTDNNESFACYANENLLKGMTRLGHKGIPVGCRNGGCGVCKVQIKSGEYEAKIMSREHVSVAEESEGIALACRVFPKSDIELSVLGKMKQKDFFASIS